MKKNVFCLAMAIMGCVQMYAHKLVINLKGVDNERGQIGLVVFTKEHYMDYQNAAWAVLVQPVKGVTTLETELPQGAYAVMVMHDENQNMTVDFDERGVPMEPTGMSNNPVLTGFPSFEQVGFSLEADKTIDINMVRY